MTAGENTIVEHCIETSPRGEARVQRKQHRADFKASVAINAIKGGKTFTELASKHSLHPPQFPQTGSAGQKSFRRKST
jgi:hypothetical protein